MLGRSRYAAPAALIAALLIGCDSAPRVEQEQPWRLQRGENLPAVTGPDSISVTFVGCGEADSVALDLNILSQMRLVSYTTKDPWENRPVKYTGVLVADLLRFFDCLQQADTLVVLAADGFSAFIPVSSTVKYNTMLGIRMDDEPIGHEEKGPFRFFWHYDSYPKLGEAMVWSPWWVERIEVR